jgi:hypothetical protein
MLEQVRQERRADFGSVRGTDQDGLRYLTNQLVSAAHALLPPRARH